MNKNKEIEEMADIIFNSRYKNDYISPLKGANELYNAGYRNCKDKVVRRDKDIVENLNREIEFLKCRLDQKNQIIERLVERESDRLKISCQETARDIFAKLKGYHHPPSNTIIIDINDFYEIVKEYGMEL